MNAVIFVARCVIGAIVGYFVGLVINYWMIRREEKKLEKAMRQHEKVVNLFASSQN